MAVMSEAERVSELHLEVKASLMNEDFEKIKNWQKEAFHKQMMGGFKETKEAEDGFRKAQKPWAKKLKEVRGFLQVAPCPAGAQRSSLVTLCHKCPPPPPTLPGIPAGHPSGQKPLLASICPSLPLKCHPYPRVLVVETEHRNHMWVMELKPQAAARWLCLLQPRQRPAGQARSPSGLAGRINFKFSFSHMSFSLRFVNDTEI